MVTKKTSKSPPSPKIGINGPKMACSVCGVPTLMGKTRNNPLRARERFRDNHYIRYCGEECEKTFFADEVK